MVFGLAISAWLLVAHRLSLSAMFVAAVMGAACTGISLVLRPALARAFVT